jgi:hypothetical protein
MSDVFLSYAREDEARIRPLVKMLEDKGLSVFWDRRIPAGETWRSYIGRALGEAHCVLVAWSWSSVSSDWVIEEAEQAKKRGVLLPFRLDPVDLPLGFGALQAADLSDWAPGRPSPPFESFARDVLEKVQEGRRRRPSAPPSSGAVTSAPAPSAAAEALPAMPEAVGKPGELKPSKKPSAKPRSLARILVLLGLAAAAIFVLSRRNQPEREFQAEPDYLSEPEFQPQAEVLGPSLPFRDRCVIHKTPIRIDSVGNAFDETQRMTGYVERRPRSRLCAFYILFPRSKSRYCVYEDGTVVDRESTVIGTCRRL